MFDKVYYIIYIYDCVTIIHRNYKNGLVVLAKVGPLIFSRISNRVIFFAPKSLNKSKSPLYSKNSVKDLGSAEDIGILHRAEKHFNHNIRCKPKKLANF